MFFILIFIILIPSIYATCTLTLNKDTYNIGETATATMLCNTPQERNQIYGVEWRDQTRVLKQNNTGITPSSTGQVFFEIYQIESGIINGTTTLVGTNLEGSDSFNIALSASSLIINNVIFRDRIFIGETTGMTFQVYDTLNNSVNGAYCTLAGADGITLAPLIAIPNTSPIVGDFGHGSYFLKIGRAHV